MTENAENIFHIPDSCPVCGSASSEEGDFLYCRNRSCPAQIRGAIYVWVKNLGLLHWGDTLLDNLTGGDNPKVQSLSDLYTLSIQDIASCCSGVKVAEKCHSTLHANKDITIELVLGSLNIPNFGLSTATDVVQAGYDTLEKIFSLTQEDLEKVPNVGKKTAGFIFDGLFGKASELQALNQVVNIKSPVVGNLTGKSFCITGDLSHPRKLVEKKILECGGVVKSSVGKTTSYLVTNDPSSGSSKLKKAASYNIPIIDEQKLFALIGL